MRPELAPLLAPGGRVGVFSDFDGTLSEIVPEPSDARPLPGAKEVLTRLARAFEVVAVVSGRSAGQLVEWLGPEVEIWGVHGAERALGGTVELDPRFRDHLPVMQRARREAQEALAALGDEGIFVEDKRVVLTLHYRKARDPSSAEQAVRSVADDIAERHGLSALAGRASVELRPPAELSKAMVVTRRGREVGLTAALFAGDDTGDVPAFAALDELAAGGLKPVKVAARSAEAPPALLEAADVVVDGPRGVLTLLGELADAAS